MTYPDWFTQTAKPNFEKHLAHLAGQDDLSFLQLGAFTGDASVWLADNILTGKYNLLIDVDTWQGSDESAHKTMDFSDVYKTYLEKVKKYRTVESFAMSTIDFFMQWDGKTMEDFIYIDADHTTAGVLVDGELSWRCLKSGGIMAFDDYTWSHESFDPRLAPKDGIDLFLHRHEGEYEVLEVNTQYWIKKK
jgi:predicted O-methyltransferase YrrM